MATNEKTKKLFFCIQKFLISWKKVLLTIWFDTKVLFVKSTPSHYGNHSILCKRMGHIFPKMVLLVSCPLNVADNILKLFSRISSKAKKTIVSALFKRQIPRRGTKNNALQLPQTFSKWFSLFFMFLFVAFFFLLEAFVKHVFECWLVTDVILFLL